MPEDGPKEYPTAQLAKVTPRPASDGSSFEETVLTALSGMRGDIKEVRTDTGSLVENARITNERLGRLELWRENVQERMGRSSERVRDVSIHDMAQEAKIAEEIVRRGKLEDRVEAIAKEVCPTEPKKRSPMVRLSLENKATLFVVVLLAVLKAAEEFGFFARH